MPESWNKFMIVLLAVLFAAVCIPHIAYAQESEDCDMCHSDTELTMDRDGREVNLHIDLERYQDSVHGFFSCIDCHSDLDGVEFPHDTPLEKPECAMCHDDVAEIYDENLHGFKDKDNKWRAPGCDGCHTVHYVQPAAPSGEAQVNCGRCHSSIAREYAASFHGQKVVEGELLAPRCWDCHDSHALRGPEDPDSDVNRFNIPIMCGKCHKEGTEVTQKYDIPQEQILEHYSQSIHGEGLYTRGLTVSAVCSDCHTAHNIREHTDPLSSTNPDNIGETCKLCHARIEAVHDKVIRGELWQSDPQSLPVCSDCHQPHEIQGRKIGVTDGTCLECHGVNDSGIPNNPDIPQNLLVDLEDLRGSIHHTTSPGVSCAQCHTGIIRNWQERPCEVVTPKVDCSICHAEVVDQYSTGMHGLMRLDGNENAPDCTKCHGTHGILKKNNPASPTFPKNVPTLCAQCHRKGQPGAVHQEDWDKGIIESYAMSIHGKGLIESGLVVTAMCTDCHTAHHVLPGVDEDSSVNPKNIPDTCGKCHHGIQEQFEKSIHSRLVNDTDKRLPNCSDCHSSHTIERTDKADFREVITDQCGECHKETVESYFETVHGKASQLADERVALCQDCHGAHGILPPDSLDSTLSVKNVVETCGNCHEGSHRGFTRYLTHATHHDRDKYPVLYWTFKFMTTLLVSVFIFFGIHTLLWLPKSLQAMKHARELRKQVVGKKEFKRFTKIESRLHILVVISFLSLAVTGMTLKFAYMPWAQAVAGLLGGFEGTGLIHRIAAIITFYYFARHLLELILKTRRSGKSVGRLLLDKNSMVPNLQDFIDFYDTIKWFLGLGPRPNYGKWTYWEKFDYFAVFWGVAMIGFTGLMLWFPEFFTKFMPGQAINVAMIIHSDEALLAVGFIFTIHFFNTHFRPDRFPMDTVIFTGSLPVEELKEDRPRYYQELVETGELDKHLVEPMHPGEAKFFRRFGWVALTIGVALIVMIIWTEIFGYQ